jgi:hypothetical protein
MAESGNGTLEYEGKIIAKENTEGLMDLGNKSFSPSGTFLKSSVTDGYPNNFDVKIDEKEYIYIMDILNSRIQEFDNRGKHVKDIPVKNTFKTRWNKSKGMKEYDNLKDEIGVTDGKLFVRDHKKIK